MSDRLLKVLNYAKNNIQHPENRGYQFSYIQTDGVVLNPQTTSKQAREAADLRIKKLEEYEEFVKDLNEILSEYTNKK